jgi:hypothetical protein
MGSIVAKNLTKVTVIAEAGERTFTFTIQDPEPGAELRVEYDVPFTARGTITLTATGGDARAVVDVDQPDGAAT